MEKLKCFIACAFGKEDVDHIYENSILKVLKNLDIVACRVDKVEHNDDIDDKIINLIRECNICITDLTYARPSAYFEAGFFLGLNKPVVFTARSDHFNSNENDEFGNFRIHFDLQMKNIIDWNNLKKTKTFEDRLISRIKYVCKPIYKMLNEKSISNIEKEEFIKYSQKQKIELLQQLTIDKIKEKNKKYEITKLESMRKVLHFNKNDKLFFFAFTNSATKAYWDNFSPNRLARDFYDYNISNKDIVVFYISIRKIPMQRIEDYFQEGVQILKGKIIEYENANLRNNITKYRILFISDFKSFQEYKNDLDNFFQTLENAGYFI